MIKFWVEFMFLFIFVVLFSLGLSYVFNTLGL
jgi:hypothetical protein